MNPLYPNHGWALPEMMDDDEYFVGSSGVFDIYRRDRSDEYWVTDGVHSDWVFGAGRMNVHAHIDPNIYNHPDFPAAKDFILAHYKLSS